MANYNVKYRGQFRDVDNILWTVDILKEGTVGTIEEITLADPPVNIEYQQEDVFQPLKCSAATIRVLTPKILDIYTGKIDVKIQIYKNNGLFWEGWNTPNIYSSEYATDLDLIEINAIDNIAALEYSKYNCKQQTNVLIYSTQDFIDALGNHLSTTWTTNPYIGGIEISTITVSENPIQPNIHYVSYTFHLPDDTTKTFEFTLNNVNEGLREFALLNLPITLTYNELTSEFIFSGTDLYDISSYPYVKRETAYNPSRVTVFDILNRIVDKNIIYYSENDINIEDIYINEDVFLDEDDNPITNKEVINYINRYLGTTMYQYGSRWGFDYYMIDTVNYYKALLCGYVTTFKRYKTDGTIETFSTVLQIPQMTVAENNSQISYGDIYNQITVQAKLDVEDADKTGDIYKNINYLSYEVATTTNNKYEIYHYQSLQALQYLMYYPSTTTTTFDQYNNVTYMDNGAYYKLQNVDESAGYKNLYYPHPSFDKYYKYNYSFAVDETFTETKRITTNVYEYKEPKSIFTYNSEKIINTNGSNYSKNLVINWQFYLANVGEPAPYVSPEQQTKYSGTKSEEGEGIINFLWAKVQVGEKYWNGFRWTTTPEWFTIGIGGEETTDTNIKSDTWYSVSNTTSPKSKLTGWSIPMPLGAYLNGNVTVTLGIPQYRSIRAKTFSDQGDDWIEVEDFGTQSWHDGRNIQLSLPADYGQLSITSLEISSIYIKDLSITVESTNYDEDLSEGDIIYSQELDNTLVQSMDDVTMLINSYDEDLGMDMSSSYALFNNGTQYLTHLTNYGLYINPEQQVVHKYCNYYQKPKLIASNTFYMNSVEPLDIIKIPYLDSNYMVGNIEYDLRYKQVNITGYEI